MISRIAAVLGSIVRATPAPVQPYPGASIRMFAPFTAGGPTDILARTLNLTDVRSRIVALGAQPIANSPSAFDAFRKAEMARWARVIKDSGAKAE